MRFKIGDRVRVTKGTVTSPVGSTGTVVDEGEAPWLAMDHKTPYVWTQYRNVDCLGQSSLEPIEENSKFNREALSSDRLSGSGNAPLEEASVAATDPILDRYFKMHETLQERGSRYGDFTWNAAISQHLKQVLQHDGNDVRPGWLRCSAVQREALEMIAQKIARILNGDPNYKDNWHDIQGYAKLAEERCK